MPEVIDVPIPRAGAPVVGLKISMLGGELGDLDFDSLRGQRALNRGQRILECFRL